MALFTHIGLGHKKSLEFSEEDFEFSSNCVISPSGKYCAAGALNGRIFIWNVNTSKLESKLDGKEHR